MKLNYRIGIMATIVAGLTFISQANAQRQLVGDDGIAASPKVRAQLDERKAVVASSTAPSMACPKCKDAFVSVPTTSAKAAQLLVAGGVPTQKILRHLCPGCDTTISVAGTGKDKHSVATHTCTSCGAVVASCCSTKTSETATKGMDKNIEIAPIK